MSPVKEMNELLFPALTEIVAERKHICTYQNRLSEDVLFHPEIDCAGSAQRKMVL